MLLFLFLSCHHRSSPGCGRRHSMGSLSASSWCKFLGHLQDISRQPAFLLSTRHPPVRYLESHQVHPSLPLSRPHRLPGLARSNRNDLPTARWSPHQHDHHSGQRSSSQGRRQASKETRYPLRPQHRDRLLWPRVDRNIAGQDFGRRVDTRYRQGVGR